MIMRSIITVAVLASLGTVSASAAPKGGAGNTVAGKAGWTQSDNANENACFGQSRAWWASNLGQGTPTSLPAGTSNGRDFAARPEWHQPGKQRQLHRGILRPDRGRILIKMGGAFGRRPANNILPRVVVSACRRREWSGAARGPGDAGPKFPWSSTASWNLHGHRLRHR